MDARARHFPRHGDGRHALRARYHRHDVHCHGSSPPYRRPKDRRESNLALRLGLTGKRHLSGRLSRPMAATYSARDGEGRMKRWLMACVFVLMAWAAPAWAQTSYDAHKNFATTTVATAPSPATSGTSLVVTGGTGSRFPATPFNATIGASGAACTPSTCEIVRVTNRSTDTDRKS